ncbi:MAG: nucleotide exchange factor GrpE [Parvularculales bacterium]
MDNTTSSQSSSAPSSGGLDDESAVANEVKGEVKSGSADAPPDESAQEQDRSAGSQMAAGDDKEGADKNGTGKEGESPSGEPPDEDVPDEDAEDDVAALKEKLLRAMAEMENTRRRAERDRAEAWRFGIMKLARDILSVADNMERTLEAVRGQAEEGPDTVKMLVDGVEATRREFLSIMERHGVKPVNPKGERFDPNFHEALFEMPGTDLPAGHVVEVVRVGYVLEDRLLRAAQVGVANAESTGDDSTEDDRTKDESASIGSGNNDNSESNES